VDRGKAVGDAWLDLGKGAVAGKAGVVDEQVEPPLPGDPILDEEELLGIREVGDEEVDIRRRSRPADGRPAPPDAPAGGRRSARRDRPLRGVPQAPFRYLTKPR